MIRFHNLPKRRAGILFIFPLLLVGVIARLFYIQIVEHEYYDNLAARQQVVSYELDGPRGKLLDRAGRSLAESYLAHSVWCDPSLVSRESFVDFARTAEELLHINAEELIEKVLGSDKKFLWIRHHLDTQQVKEIADKVFTTRGVYFKEEWVRHYAVERLMSPVLGVVGYDHNGLTGLESYFDKQLKGKKGKRRVFRDARRRMIQLRSDWILPPRSGATVKLTLDSSIQTFVYHQLEKHFVKYKPISASAVVLDVQTGEILALVTLPSHSPGDTIKKGLDGLIPRAVTDLFEPGSTMKPFVYAAALQNKLATPEETVHCGNGYKLFGTRALHDVHGYGKLSFKEVMIKSSNIGTAYLAERLGNNRLYAALDRVGFGHRNYLPVPAESAGILRKPEEWSGYSAISISIGHEVAVNLVQLANAYATLANGGYVMQPFLVREIVNDEGEIVEEKSTIRFRRAFSEQTCLRVREALEQVVEKGTARKASSDLFRIAGKTGTTEKLGPKGYLKDKNISVFAGFAPVSNPRVAIAVMFDEPEAEKAYGGIIAAPPASLALEEILLYMGVAPDKTGDRKS